MRVDKERELVKDKPISNVENEFAKMKILIFENNEKLSVKYKVNTEYDTIKYWKNNFFCFTFWD